MITIHDIFIGDYPITQNFGENPQIYSQFKDPNGKPLIGHNGIDFGTPDKTPLVNCFNSAEVIEANDDKTGYGLHVKIWDKVQKCVAIYGHMKELAVTVNQQLVAGELLGYSDNSGFSTGPHLHFAIIKVDDNCVRQNIDNGYAGWLNPLNKRSFVWDVKNLQAPVTPPPPAVVPIDPDKVKIDLGGDWGTMEVQAIRSKLNDMARDIKAANDKVKILDGFVAKWISEWNLKTGSTLVDVENEMSKLLLLEDQNQILRDAIESTVGIFDTDKALLEALGAIRTEIKHKTDEISILTQRLEDVKVPKGYKVKKSWYLLGDRYLFKMYRKEVS